MTTPQPLSYRFQGEISVPAGREFTYDYIQLPFEVPAGVREIALRLRYLPVSVGGVSNLITLGLFDPLGFRGNAHRNPPDEQVRLASDGATVGFIPGPLPPGAWLAQLAVHSVVADGRAREHACEYTLEIDLHPGEDGQAAPLDWQPRPFILSEQPGWYRGELHSHTLHSDADWTAADLIAASRLRGLDFLFITDHNTHSVYHELSGNEPEGLLLIPGIELTTFEGHALVLGIKDWVDWRSGYAGRTMEDAAREIQQAGGLFVIAHPFAAGSPFCTGCRWDYHDFALPGADGIEVWNGQWGSEGDKNPEGLRLWHELVKNGVRVAATAGTDIHTARDWSEGAPMVYVHAQNLSSGAVLEGIRAGRLILSSGPWIDLRIRAQDDTPGGSSALRRSASSPGGRSALRRSASSLGAPAGVPEGCGVGETCLAASRSFTLAAEWDAAPLGAQLVIRDSQDVLEVVEVSGKGTVSQDLTVEREERFWLELYGADGALLALTNPATVQTTL